LFHKLSTVVPLVLNLRWKESEKLGRLLADEARAAHDRFGRTQSYRTREQ
jgi:hypothetical protein